MFRVGVVLGWSNELGEIVPAQHEVGEAQRPGPGSEHPGVGEPVVGRAHFTAQRIRDLPDRAIGATQEITAPG